MEGLQEWWRRRITAVLWLMASAAAGSIPNDHVLIDMTQNNPGDAVAWQQTKYFDPRVLAKAGYTAQSSTGETSGTQAVDFHSTGFDFFPSGSPQRQWLDAYTAGIESMVRHAKASGLKAYFFVDLLVFPTFVVDHFKSEVAPKGTILWNNTTRYLLGVLVNETFSKFPGCDGFIVRTGETYVYDTPYHKGNSPSDGSVDRWVSFISALRSLVCEGHGRDLFIRTWDNWPSSSSYYLQLTNQIPTHRQLYFSIKYTAGDFLRNQPFNQQLGVGKHAQIVEVELQREYEGKGAYPNYVMDIAIDGPKEYELEGVAAARRNGSWSSPSCLSDLVGKDQIRGLWTWTRGGGWWGPYIHGNEMHIDLHFESLTRWWKSNFGPGRLSTDTALTEPQAFSQACSVVFAGCTTQNK